MRNVGGKRSADLSGDVYCNNPYHKQLALYYGICEIRHRMKELTRRGVGRPPLPEHKKPVAITLRLGKKHHALFLRMAKNHGSQRKTLEHLIDHAEA